MLAQYLIAFRESFEASLISTIIFSYLYRINKSHLSKYIWIGIFAAIITSIAIGASLHFLYGIFPRNLQILFEATSAFTAVTILSIVIYWMATTGKRIREKIEERIGEAAIGESIIGLTSFSFIIVFREGLETVLFLTPFYLTDTLTTLIGVFLGVLSSLFFSYIALIIERRIDPTLFFYYTSIILVLIAGGLVGYGVHELIEYLEVYNVQLGWLAEPIYTLNIPESNLLHDKNIVGSVLAVLIGYTVEAEWLRLLTHLLYLLVMLTLIFRVYRRIEGKKTHIFSSLQ